MKDYSREAYEANSKPPFLSAPTARLREMEKLGVDERELKGLYKEETEQDERQNG